MLILRPLSTMNKPEIMDIAQDIGTKKFAENMPEYCGVISQNPIVHGSYKRMAEQAKKFNYEVLDKAVELSTSIYVHDIVNDIKNISQIETISDISSGEFTIIDIREEGKDVQFDCELLKIPFHLLKNKFKKLPQDKQYLLYCDKGIMSQLHAQYLVDEEKYTNVRVYRPQE